MRGIGNTGNSMWVSRETIAARTRVTAGEFVGECTMRKKHDKILRVPIRELCVGKSTGDNFPKMIFCKLDHINVFS